LREKTEFRDKILFFKVKTDKKDITEERFW